MIEVYFRKINKFEETIVTNEFLLNRIKDTNDEKYKKLRINAYSYLLKILKEKGINQEFICNEYGKLYIKGNPLFFNISHTKDAFVIAFSTKEIGVDIEVKREYDKETLDKLISKCNSKEEVVNNSNDFIKLWTAKESFLKLIGTGIINSLKDVKVLDKVYCGKNNAYYKIIEKDNYYISVSYNEYDEIKMQD